jgi:hypothetical protein
MKIFSEHFVVKNIILCIVRCRAQKIVMAGLERRIARIAPLGFGCEKKKVREIHLLVYLPYF